MIKIYNNVHPLTSTQTKAVSFFLFNHLEQFGDPQEDIEKAIDYALKPANESNGIIVTSWDREILTGAIVVNRTGMKGYIPENILVYVATHRDYRGKGLGKEMMTATIEKCEGDIALHVEPTNPAKRLYERLGFTNKYLEMRLKKNN